MDEDAVTLPEEPPELTDEQKEEIAEGLDKISRAMTGCDEKPCAETCWERLCCRRVSCVRGMRAAQAIPTRARRSRA